MGTLIYDKPLFVKTIWSALTIISFSVYGIIGSSKTKNELNYISGRIEFIDDKYLNLPNRSFGKYRFIKISNESKPFEVFIGKESGDFKPTMEKIDQLKSGDSIVLYLNSLNVENNDVVNRSVEIIEHNNEPYYIGGNSKFWIFVFCLSTGAGIAICAMIFKSLGKII